MTIYVRGENPIWFFNNLTGQVLDDTYWAFFLTNDLPYIPQAVYQDPNGISPWSNPIRFQPSGGLPNNLYFNPSLTYRIEIRQGPTQTAPLIWPIQNYVPGSGGGGGANDNPLITASNIITNPQFADVYFESPFTYTQGSVGSYTVDVGPGWQLLLTGSGTTVLTQVPIAGVTNTFGNPTYYLKIDNSGWSTASLVQTLQNNGAIFANGAIAVSFTAAAIASNENVSVVYIPNGPSNSQDIFTGQIRTGGFDEYYGLLGGPRNAFLPSMNNNDGTDANVQISFVLPISGVVELTNIQVTGQSTAPTSAFVEPTSTTQGSVPDYQELTYEQVVNAEFHVYKDAMLSQSKDSILTGWNFGNNPWQFRSTAASNVANNTYTADQTIVVQQAFVASATANNVAVSQGTASENLPFKVAAVTATNKFALIQYVDAASIRQYWGRIMSSRVMANVSSPTHSTQCKFKMRLIYRTTLPSTVAQAEPVASWTNVDGSNPVFSAGWTAVAPLNDPEYTFSDVSIQSFDFNHFQLPASAGANMTLGIVLYTTTNLVQTATADTAIFYDISLVPNNFALPTQAETWDQTLAKCRYYYEKSYAYGVLAGTNTNTGMQYKSNPLGGDYSSTVMYKNSFELQYNHVKRVAPSVSFYSLDGTLANVQVGVFTGAAYPAPGAGVNPRNLAIAGNWTATGATVNGVVMRPADAAAIMSFAAVPGADQGEILFHYVADARLGL